MTDTFWIDDVDAATVGIQLQEPVRLGEPEPEVSSVAVPGRNGNRLFYTGAYKPRPATARCFLLQEAVVDGLANVNKFLLQVKGYHKLKFTPDTERFVMARVRNGAEVAARAAVLAPFTIRWECRPQRFTVDQGTVDVIDSPGSTQIHNQHIEAAAPLIVLPDGGIGSITVSGGGGNKVIEVKKSVPQLHIDCDTMQAYSPAGPQNDAIFCEDFPVLSPGENAVALDGIKRAQFTPRWWDL